MFHGKHLLNDDFYVSPVKPQKQKNLAFPSHLIICDLCIPLLCILLCYIHLFTSPHLTCGPNLELLAYPSYPYPSLGGLCKKYSHRLLLSILLTTFHGFDKGCLPLLTFPIVYF